MLRRTHVWRYRALNLALTFLILAGIILPIANNLVTDARYELSATAHELVGTTDSRLSKQLSWDDRSQAWTFNAAGLSATANLPGGAGAASAIAAMRAQVGTPGGSSSDTPTYSLTLPKDLSKGVTYTDVNTGLSFSLVPEFKSWPGRIVDGHIVYPLEHGLQAIYTLKHNGLKEDIYIPHPDKYQTYSMNLYYKTKLPKTLELKKIPNGDGALGLYSADPTLFGNVSTTTDKDKASLQKAQETGDKTNLVFGLPAPVVVAPKGQSTKNALGRFEVFQDQLMVIADNLHNLTTPVSLDPSVVVTSSSDFQTNGNNEGNIDFTTSGQITRGGLTGGTVGSWANANTVSPFSGARTYPASVAYNGYLYIIGGSSGGIHSDIQYAAINANGTIGAWTTNATGLSSARSGLKAVAYNGRLYVVGGYDGSTFFTNVEYASLNADGSVGSFTTTASLPAGRADPGVAAYNGYLYAAGGSNSGAMQSTVYYAPFNADGTVGSWASTTSFATARTAPGVRAYNGYLYLVGGLGSSSTMLSDVQYAKLNADGTVGSWASTTALPTALHSAGIAVYNGYLYIVGGSTDASCSAYTAAVQYVQINANGTLGAWRTTSSLSTARCGLAAVAYNGYLYASGGSGSSLYDLTEYAQIDRAGQPVAFGTLTNNFTTARALACSVAYNGYLYAIGGSTNDSSDSNVTTVQYAALNSSTGNNGSWSSTTALPVARGSSGCVAYNGYLYVVGGFTGTGGVGAGSGVVLYVAINSNGTLAASWTTSGNSLQNIAGARPGVLVYTNSNGTYIYAAGGRCEAVAGSSCSDVQYATLNVSNGSVGTWDTATNGMSQQWAYRGYAMVGKYLYAFGGYKNNPSDTMTTDAEYTSINSDGSLATWQSTASLNTAAGFTNGTTVNGCIYAIGGDSTSSSLSNVQYACPNANGTISAWHNAPNLTVATTDMGVTSYNGYIYGVGGYTTSVQTTTQYAYVNNGGSGDATSWSIASNGLASGRMNAAATAYNGYAYVVGGSNGSTVQNSVQYAAFGNNGDMGAFTNDSHTLITAREAPGSVAYNGYLYVVGGQSASTEYGSVEYAPINSTGGLSGNFATTTSFVTGSGSDTGREGPCVVAYNGYIYATGGWDGTVNYTTTRYAAINSNGTLGSWADSGNNFANGRSDHGCFVANGYLYIVGGDGASAYNDVQAAPINSNGTLGTWTYTASLPGVHKNAAVGYSNGLVYVTGGCKQSACTSGYGDTMYAPVYPGGTLGPWQISANKIPTSYTIYNTTGFAYNGFMYTFGGDGTVSRSDAYYSPLASIPRTARYSKLIDLGVPTNISSITYNGTLPTSSATPGIAPIYFRAAGSDGVFGSVTSSSAITPGATGCLASNQNYVRYLEVTILLDGSGTQAILPDAAGTLSNVTDFTVNYTPVHPPPNIRLRGGQTLQQGNLSALDTCTP